MALMVFGTLSALVLIAVVAAVVLLQSGWFYLKVRTGIVATVEKATGGHVEIGSLHFYWRELRAEVRNFVLHGTEPPGKPPLLQADRVSVGLKIVSLARRDVNIDYLEVA